MVHRLLLWVMIALMVCTCINLPSVAASEPGTLEPVVDASRATQLKQKLQHAKARFAQVDLDLEAEMETQAGAEAMEEGEAEGGEGGGGGGDDVVPEERWDKGEGAAQDGPYNNLGIYFT